MIRRFYVSLKPWMGVGAMDDLMIDGYTKTRKIFPPLCMDCKHFLHPFVSPHFPNPSCKRFTKVMPCIEARRYDILCGWEGKKFERKEERD